MRLQEMPPNERPRERMAACGSAALSDEELLTIILGSGRRGRDVITIAKELLQHLDSNLHNLAQEKLTEIPGIGPAKAAKLLAALEFARRRFQPSGIRISKPTDILPLVQHLADRKQEHFIAVSLNGAHEVIATRTITIGLINSTQVHPRETFSDAICDRAAAIIVAHNHPSGSVEPSEEDRKVTKLLAEAGRILGIKVLDHVIFSTTGHYSFANNGEI